MKNLFQTLIQTPLGDMIAIADDSALLVLAFADQPNINQRISKLTEELNATLTHQDNHIHSQLKHELTAYFSGDLKAFSVPLAPTGTPFQQAAWSALQSIPYGTTSHYQAQAKSLLQPTAFRACARANGNNWIAIVIPCHRIIKKNGDLCGYNAGIHRKEWLLKHEAKTLSIRPVTTILLKEKPISF